MEAQNAVFLYALKNLMGGTPDKALMDPEVSHTVWESTVGFAEAANEPGKFTAFCSYEWTSMPNAMNLHRNIFFKDCKHIPPAPFSALELDRSLGPVEMDGRPAQGRQRASGDLAQRQPFRRAHVSDRGRSPWTADRPRLRRRPDAQRAADRARPNQGTVGNPSRCCRPTTNSPTTTSGPFCSATRRGALRISSAATPARR